MQQTNTKAIAIGTNASATTIVRQKLDTPANPSMNASATIGGTSFSNGNGILGVNQGPGEQPDGQRDARQHQCCPAER